VLVENSNSDVPVMHSACLCRLEVHDCSEPDLLQVGFPAFRFEEAKPWLAHACGTIGKGCNELPFFPAERCGGGNELNYKLAPRNRGNCYCPQGPGGLAQEACDPSPSLRNNGCSRAAEWAADLTTPPCGYS
jgi:hypothetical protein